MQMTDLTQKVRRIRAVLNSDDLKMLLAKTVADEAKVDLTDPDVRVCSVDVHAGNLPHAEVIIEVQP